jgi:PAS domain S-box-containing protein
LVSPSGAELWKAVANRLLALFAIWTTAALVWHYKRLTVRHHLAEQRALRSERQFRAAIESSPTGMLLVNPEGRIVVVNREAERLLGYARDELLNRPVEALLPQVAGEARAMHRAAFVAERWSRRLGAGREVTAVDKQGREIPIEAGLARVDTPDGVLALVTVVDLTARKQLEQARSEQALARVLVEAEEAQRKHIAREIHDALGQVLTALKLDIGWLAKQLSAAQPELHGRAVEMAQLAAGAIDEVRRLSAALRPSILDDQGLLAAIRWLVSDFEKHSGLHFRLALPDADIPWNAERCTVAFRVLQEALSNVVHHAKAKTVSVTLWREEQGDGLLDISDDGCGIDTERAARPGALGLISMRERALLQDGKLTVNGIAGAGTTVLLRMPCRLDEPVADALLPPAQDAAIAQTAEGRT